MTATDINRMDQAERVKLAARVRYRAGNDDGLTDADLDAIEQQIEQGQVNRILAHYVTQLRA